MPQLPACKETIRNMYDTMGQNFTSFVPELCYCVSVLEKLDNKNTQDEDIQSFSRLLLKLHTFSMIINLDLSAFLRADFRTYSPPEKRCHLKYINTILIEGYNYLFGFKRGKKYAIFKIIRQETEQICDNELIEDIENIEKEAIEFKNIYAQRADQDKRNLSIHYDSDPLKVYDLLCDISEDFEVKRVSAFLKVLDRIIYFNKKYMVKYKISTVGTLEDLNIDIWEKINHFENTKLFNELEGATAHFSEKLDRVVSQCKKPQIIKDKLKLDNTFSDRFTSLVESIFPSIHIYYIYMDLVSTVRAFLSSEFYLEKQLNLRRIQIIVYEGFKHLYGYNENDKIKSFWNKCISSILKETKDSNLLKSLDEIEIELKKLESNKGIDSTVLRECFVHYRYKERDNVILLFNTLVKSNPLIEMNKALKLLELLPKLLKINADSVKYRFNKEQENIKRSNNRTLTQMNELISMTERININSEQKQEILEMINNIKKLFERTL